MNNRNQAQTNRNPAAAANPATTTYLNVFTVDEYERDGKAQKRWTKTGAAASLIP
jgi:hypothetical protein